MSRIFERRLERLLEQPQFFGGFMLQYLELSGEPMAAEITTIFEEIHEEVARQRAQWGTSFDDTHEANDWIGYIAKHAGKAADAKNVNGDARAQWIKTAALAVSAILADGRRTRAAQETTENNGG